MHLVRQKLHAGQVGLKPMGSETKREAMSSSPFEVLTRKNRDGFPTRPVDPVAKKLRRVTGRAVTAIAALSSVHFCPHRGTIADSKPSLQPSERVLFILFFKLTHCQRQNLRVPSPPAPAPDHNPPADQFYLPTNACRGMISVSNQVPKGVQK